jgi:hypothetical protein
MASKAKRRAQESREAGKKQNGEPSISNHSKVCSKRVNVAADLNQKTRGQVRGGEHASIFENQFRE